MQANSSGPAPWLIAAILVPVTTIAVGWFSYLMQARMAERVEKYLEKRMDTLEKQLADVKMSITEARNDIKSDLNTNVSRLEASMRELKSDLKDFLRSEINAASSHRKGQGAGNE